MTTFTMPSPYGPGRPAVAIDTAPSVAQPLVGDRERAVTLAGGYHLRLRHHGMPDAVLEVRETFAGVPFTAAAAGMDAVVAEYVLRTLGFDVDFKRACWTLENDGDLVAGPVRQLPATREEAALLATLEHHRGTPGYDRAVPMLRLARAVGLEAPVTPR